MYFGFANVISTVLGLKIDRLLAVCFSLDLSIRGKNSESLGQEEIGMRQGTKQGHARVEKHCFLSCLDPEPFLSIPQLCVHFPATFVGP